jgi:hypothetical protein
MQRIVCPDDNIMALPDKSLPRQKKSPAPWVQKHPPKNAGVNDI